MLQVLETPGHTPEHVAYLLKDGSSPRVLFSGGTLMAGGVARPDLISEADTVPLARLAFRSVRRLLGTLPVDIEVRPTHGAGSFCSSPEAEHHEMTTVAIERFTHPAMTTSDEDVFVGRLLSGLGSYPSYFLRLREVNRAGPTVYGVDLRSLPGIGPDDVEGHTIVDVRPIERFSTGHVPGSISIALRDQFGTWLGWLLEPDASVVFVIDPDQDERELTRQALNVGYENIIGRIDLAEWRAAGRELATIPIVSGSAVDPTSPILDVRQDSEWSRGHLPDASHLELGALAGGAADVGPGTIVHCGHGQRAMTAASLLARAGKPPSAVTAAGYNEIQRAVAVS